MRELDALEPAPPGLLDSQTNPQKEPEPSPVMSDDNPALYSIKIQLFAIWKEHFHASVPSSLPSIAPAAFFRHGGEIKPASYQTLKLCSGMPT